MSAPDDPAVAEALVWLRKRGFPVRQLTPYQIKIADVSYYPRQGTIFVDGEPRRRREKGLDALAELLTKKRIRPPITFEEISMSGPVAKPQLDPAITVTDRSRSSVGR